MTEGSKRREFLVKAVSWLGVGAGTWLASSFLTALWKKGPRLAEAGPGAARLKARHKLSRKQRRKAARGRVWSDPRFVGNARTGVVHWPHPGIAGHCHDKGPSGKNRKTIEAGDWSSQIHPTIRDSRLRKPQQSGAGEMHFNLRREGAIREALALSALTIDKDGSVSGLESALEILSPALRWQKRLPQIFDEEQIRQPKPMEQDWRTIVLYARFQCLAKTHDWQAAQAAILAKLKALGMQTDTSISSWDEVSSLDASLTLLNPERFKKFHGKTVETHASRNTFRKKLAGRVEQAKLISKGLDSSSGKDTRQGEESSNLSSASLYYLRRKRSIYSHYRKRVRHELKILQARLEHRPHSRRSLQVKKMAGDV